MPEAGIVDKVLTSWPQAAVLAAFVLAILALVKWAIIPLMQIQDLRTAAKRAAAKECSERDDKSKQMELESRVKVAEAQAKAATEIKDAVRMCNEMHERCHAHQASCRD